MTQQEFGLPDNENTRDPLTEVSLRLRQRIEQADLPSVLFDLLAPSRESRIGELTNELYKPLRWIAIAPPLTYQSIYQDPQGFFKPTPNVLSSGVQNVFKELTSGGSFRTYRVVAHTSEHGYELRGIQPIDLKPNSDEAQLIEEQAMFFLEKMGQMLNQGTFSQPIEVLGEDSAIPENSDLVLPG